MGIHRTRNLNGPVKQHQIVTLKEARPSEDLAAGARGVIVHEYQEGKPFEVEFSAQGKPRIITLNQEDVEPAPCRQAPRGWWCSRGEGHEGPCAARPGRHPRLKRFRFTGIVEFTGMVEAESLQEAGMLSHDDFDPADPNMNIAFEGLKITGIQMVKEP